MQLLQSIVNSLLGILNGLMKNTKPIFILIGLVLVAKIFKSMHKK